jgi:serine/threonine-protein kinase
MAKLEFDKFEIIETLKKDSYSTVYLATHIYLEKKIILKTLRTDIVEDASILQRFKREAKILAGLDHPNIIRVLDFGTSDPFFYISFEYFDSINLREVLRARELTELEKTQILVQILGGLLFASNHGIVHRDIKPENILVDSTLTVKLADFGLAWMKSEHVVSDKAGIVGTPGYMSPEQIMGDALTPQSDLFSTGIVAFELFTGKNPFLGKDVNETITNILNVDNESLKRGLEQQSPQIAEKILALLQKNPNKRAVTFEGIHQSGQSVKRSVWSSNEIIRTSKSGKRAITLVAALILALLGAYWIFFQPPTIEKSAAHRNTTDTASVEDSRPSAPESVTTHSGNSIVKKEPIVIEPRSQQPSVKTSTQAEHQQIGYLLIQCFPWAEVHIDSRFMDQTPLKAPLMLTPGNHTIKLVNPEYPVYLSDVNIAVSETLNIHYNLDSLSGFLLCQVHPWAEIFIDGTHYGQTPLKKPVRLIMGEHKLVLQNPNYKMFETNVNIRSSGMNYFRMNYDTLPKK